MLSNNKNNMGIDLTLAARTKKLRSESELKELNYRFMEASNLGYGKNPIKLADAHDSQNYYYEVDTLSRLYSEGYARGHFPEIYAAVEWMRFNFPEADILYGGDEYFLEECPVLSKEEQEEMLKFWCKNGGLTYRQRNPEKESFRKKCPNCDVVMTQFMWSGKGGGINCLGCGHKEITEDDGLTWKVEEKA